MASWTFEPGHREAEFKARHTIHAATRFGTLPGHIVHSHCPLADASAVRATKTGDMTHMRKHASQSRDVDHEEGAPARPPEGFVAQGVNFAKRFTRDRLTKPDATPVSEIAPGEAKVIGADGDRVAAYRDTGGTLHAVSAVCTHRGCVVDWNAAEKTWDCPCHGSRYDHDGHVIHGPAHRDLEVKRIEAAVEPRYGT